MLDKKIFDLRIRQGINQYLLKSSLENSLSRIYNHNDFFINIDNLLVEIIVSWAGEVSLWEQ